MVRGMAELSAHDVAAEIRSRLPGVGIKKLHKLLYYCQGHHPAAFGEPLFSETISAWDMGPVVGSLWYHERTAGVAQGAAPNLGEGPLNTIGYVVNRYGALNGTDLEHLTHNEAPWREADGRRTRGSSTKISVESLRTYFAAVEPDEDDEDTPLPDAEAVAK